MEAVQNAADGVLDAVLQGSDLRIFLEPDDTVARRLGNERYIECLRLDHVVAAGGHFWGCQAPQVATEDALGFYRSFYSYYSGLDLFGISGVRSDAAARDRRPQMSKLLSTGRYRRLDWFVGPAWTPVYDSARPADKAALIEAIEACRIFKARIDFEDGAQQVHPIFYPFYYPDSDRIDLQTDLHFFPEYMRYDKQALIAWLGPHADVFADYRDPARREKTLGVECPFFSGYYRILDGGAGKRLYDLKTDRTVAFERVVVFAQ